MSSKGRLRHIKRIAICTIAVMLVILSVLLVMINAIYTVSLDDSFHGLHLETKEIKDDINAQFASDEKNLKTIASFAAKLYQKGEDFKLVYDSVVTSGLIENIGILTSDNIYHTEMGVLDVSDRMNFKEEVEKGEYISGIVSGFINTDVKHIRRAVPIIVRGRTVAILYGLIRIDTFVATYKKNADEIGAKLFLVEKDTGDFMLDTYDDDLHNVRDFEHRKFADGYTYDKLFSDLINGVSGYSVFMSPDFEENAYVHYSPTNVSDWQILLALPESSVMSNARKEMGNLLVTVVVIIVILAMYFVILMNDERKLSKLHLVASSIRKMLLIINTSDVSITDALESVARFAMSRSAFFVDSEKEDYCYGSPLSASRLLKGDDKDKLVSIIWSMCGERKATQSVTINLVKLTKNRELAKKNPEVYEFFNKHGIYNVVFAAILSEKGHVSILGTVNAKRRNHVRYLLEEVAFCFSMAINNKKYLRKTEIVASTDALTGLYNRTTYKKDIKRFGELSDDNICCVYVDVNELHSFNNKYGHGAGDGMLIFVSNALKTYFDGHKIYRMGGDEFLVFTCGIEKEEVDRKVAELTQNIEGMDYHISVGTAMMKKTDTVDDLVDRAEKLMYVEKSMYYQKKSERGSTFDYMHEGFNMLKTGNDEIDAALSHITDHYHGIYCVSLTTDFVHRILMPTYLNYPESDSGFSKFLSKYIYENVNSDYRRAFLRFLDYEALRKQLDSGEIPCIEYKRLDGQTIIMKVYPVVNVGADGIDTIWIFEKG